MDRKRNETDSEWRLTGVAGDWIHYKLPFSLYLAWFVFAWHFLPVVLIITHLIDQSINPRGLVWPITIHFCANICVQKHSVSIVRSIVVTFTIVCLFYFFKAHYTIINSITKWYIFALVRTERTNQVRQMQFPQVGRSGQRMAGLLNSVHQMASGVVAYATILCESELLFLKKNSFAVCYVCCRCFFGGCECRYLIWYWSVRICAKTYYVMMLFKYKLDFVFMLHFRVVRFGSSIVLDEQLISHMFVWIVLELHNRITHPTLFWILLIRIDAYM